MQIVALQNVNGASSRDQAVIIAENLAEGMRASPAPYANLIIAAQADANNLPSGDLTAVPSAADPNIFVITVRWDEDRDGDVGTNCPVSTSADLDCYQINLNPN